SIPETEMLDMPDYQSAQLRLKELMTDAVGLRLVSDVPLGCFLSGGIDSSVVTALAAQQVNKLNTFSIGFKDEPFFDETSFALRVAEMHNTAHHVFKLTNGELFENLADILNYIDEPFADSSAIAVFILSKYTKKHVTVALSGDGADEIFGGYQKHRAEWLIRNRPGLTPLLKMAASVLPSKFSSRENSIKNKIRQLHRFAEGATLSNKERYLRWCSFTTANYRNELLLKPFANDLKNRNQQLSTYVKHQTSMNDVLLSDMKLVLTGDMLRKVDSMSMANSLEVRSPFLDYRVVDFAFSLTDKYKIDNKAQKKIVKDAFRLLLPEEIYHRGKRGFEVPLIKWFQTELRGKIDFLLGEEIIQSQGLFNLNSIKQLRHDVMNNPSGESQAKMWALIVFQNWWLTHHLKSN
ncbi:MAG TPA: asparagine synthase C-terminal domain-containing protein, partial [Bacteroidia bacterium]|nr:asparagine synthase C-terminal domain-containing protein [Bacteroidia bacterium]